MAKKKKKEPQSLTANQAFDAYLADQDKKKQEQANGQVRYREAASASRVQYTNPTYQGNSKNGNYKWETEALKDYKVKGVRSYNDKFDHMTNQMGMSEGQANDFRRYLDFGEDKSKDKYALKKYEYKRDEKGNLITSGPDDNELTLTRKGYTEGSGLHTKTEIIDGILSGMTQKAVQGVKNQQKRKVDEAKAQEKAQEEAKNSFWGKAKDVTMKGLEIIDRPGDAVRTGIKEKADGHSFWQGAKEGFMGDKNTSGKELNKALGFDPNKSKKDRTIANTLGMASTGALGTLIQSLNKKTADTMGNETSGMATEIALDPLNLVGGVVAKGGKALNLGKQAEEILKATGSTKYTDEAFKNALKEAYAPKGDVSNVVSDPVKEQANPQAVLDELLGRKRNVNANVAPNTMNGFNPGEIPSVETPNVLDDLFNFAQSGKGPQARGVEKIANPARYGKEALSQQADDILKATSKPDGYWNQRVLDIQHEMKGKDQQDIADTVKQAFGNRDAAEQAFIDKELAPFTDVSQQQANAQSKWESVVKGAKDEINRIKGTYGKIKATRGEGEDYPIPNQFRAGMDNMSYDDIHSFATQEGFSSVDEAVQYLKNLDETANVKLKDMMPEDKHTYTENDWNALEDAARKNFAETDHGKAVDQLIADLLDPKNKSNFDALYGATKGADDPATFDDLVRYAQMEANGKPIPKNIKAMLHSDPRIAEAVKALNGLGGKPKGAALPHQNVSSLDEMLSFLEGKSGRTIPNAPTPGLPQNIDELLKNAKNVNNSQTPEQVLEQLASSSKKLSMKDFNDLVSGKKVETEAVSPAPVSEVPEAGKEPLVKMNLQRFDHDSNPKLFTDGVVKSEGAIDSTLGKFYEGYVNSNHSFKVAHEKVLTRAIEKAKAEGKPKKAAQLEGQLKDLKKSGSTVEQAVSNEVAAGVSAKAFLKRNLKELDGVVKDDKEMAEALTYMFAKDLKWRKDNGLAEYELPEGVDWGQLNDIINRGDLKDHFKNDFVDKIHNITQEWRDIMLDSGLINKEQHEALSKNPYYMPLQRDLSGQLDNIDRGGTSLSGSANHRASGPSIVHKMGKGDVDSFYKNPIETLINNTFAVYKNAYKEESHRQFLRMAEMDTDGVFFKKISGKQYQSNSEGGIKVANGGKPQYIRIQKDLMKVLDENDEVMKTDVLGKLTSMFAGLKTRSLEYQMTAAYRDLATNYLTSQITNPFRYMGEAFRSIKNGNKDVKAVGGYFDKAYNDHVGGVDPAKVMDEFKKSYGGTVETFNPKSKESWKKAAQVVGKYLDMPFKPIKKLGEITDEIPRDIEVRETERLFMKKNGQKIENLKNYLNQVNEQIAQADDVTDPFDPRLQGIDKLKGQKSKLEGMLNKFDQELKREQLYRSRDVINYQRHGRGGVAKKIRQWVVFANTTTQSKDKVIRSFIERPGATAMKTALLISPFITAQKIMHMNMSDSDKQTYDALPNYVKQNNYVFVNGGKLFTIPKVQELALLSDPIEAMLQGEELNDSGRFLAKELTPYQLGNVTQGLVPDAEGKTLFDRDPMTKNVMGVTAPSTVLTPFLDVMVNDKTGFNRKPISFSADKANDWTLGVFKDLIGNNPNADATQYLVQQLGGDYGKYGSYAADYLTNPTNADKLDELLRNLNPLQDRHFNNDSRVFKPIPQEKKKFK